jgi:hypothetical protein
MKLDHPTSNRLRYLIVDNYLSEADFNIVVSENERLHGSASNNVFSELSQGKTTIRSLDNSSILLSPKIVLDSLTSDTVKNQVKEFLGFETNIYSLLDFPERGGHSFFHRMLPGSFLGLHVDRSYLPGTSMVKVANALLYTSPSWNESHGGNLYFRQGLSGRDKAYVKCMPNRLVLLFHTSKTFHGVSQLCARAPIRYSAYMDFYVDAGDLRKSGQFEQFWLHETVYLPEFKHLFAFLRGFGYSFHLINYMKRKKFIHL